MKEIPLSRGKVALVDDEDYENLIQFKWCANRGYRYNHTFYAVRHTPKKVNISKPLIGMPYAIIEVPKGFVVDHIDGDGLNNQKSNLRVVTVRGNNQNRHKKTSLFPGVCWNKNVKKWQSQINVTGKVYYLGVFADELEAATTYKVACAVMGVN
jgi:hypothetical protein